jgi:hypothetical protein
MAAVDRKPLRSAERRIHVISDSIRTQSKQIFANIQSILDVVNEENLNSTIGVFPVWKQLYHLLHSMDQNFVDPADFTEPSFHTKNLDVIFLEAGESPGLARLVEYFEHVRVKIEAYIASLDDRSLEVTVAFRDMRLTRMELILAQFRHIFYHVGYLHCCFKTLNGKTPDYVGLYETIPER